MWYFTPEKKDQAQIGVQVVSMLGKRGDFYTTDKKRELIQLPILRVNLEKMKSALLESSRSSVVATFQHSRWKSLTHGRFLSITLVMVINQKMRKSVTQLSITRYLYESRFGYGFFALSDHIVGLIADMK